MKKILVVQTAFIGDVILATALIEKLHIYFPDSQIDFLLRKGNESLFTAHPFLHEVVVWDKKNNKYLNWRKILLKVRREKYDLLVNLQRFASMGLLAGLSKAKKIIGFRNTPFAFLFHEKYEHRIGDGTHEVERNQLLITKLTDSHALRPQLYPSLQDEEAVKPFQSKPYICIAPASVWFTKQYPKHKWVELILALPKTLKIYLLGSPSDQALCEAIVQEIKEKNHHEREIENLCGKLSLLASAALMRKAVMNYVNDSAPLHLASAVNAPTCAVFCSTVPEFGFTPLAEKSHIVQINNRLSCRPCGLHGQKQCPQHHFRCAEEIQTEQLVRIL